MNFIPFFPIGVLLCTTPMFGQVQLAEKFGDHAAASMGNALAAGDVNNDGITDWIVGIRNGQEMGQALGKVRVFSGIDGSVLLNLTGTAVNSGFGFAVDYAGDVNMDGFGDVVVGAPFHQELGEVQNGRAFVFSGQTGALLFQFGGLSFFDSLGLAVGGVGDVNMDGRDDVALGAPGMAGGGPQSGGVIILSGINGSILHTLNGQSAGDLLGSSFAALGDLNSDGHADFAVGARGRDFGLVDIGSVTVFSGQSGLVLYEQLGFVEGQNAGLALAAIGDIDADGHTDWITGCSLDPRGGVQAGSFQVHSGLAGGLLYDVVGTTTSERLGERVAGCGDMDGDGKPDWAASAIGDSTMAGASGRVQIHSSVDGSITCSLYGKNANDLLGAGLAAAADFNGDFIPDIAIGIPGDDTNGIQAGAFQIYSGCRLQGINYCGPAPDNSSGGPASIQASGSASASVNQLTLIASGVPVGKFGYFLVAETSGFIANPAGSQGNLCLGNNIGRYNRMGQIFSADSAGRMQLSIDLTDLQVTGSHVVVSGETWFFQGWFRDINPGNTSNFTDGVALLFQ